MRRWITQSEVRLGLRLTAKQRNNGWADCRDRHLGPELKAFENLGFAHSGTKVTVLPGGESAFADVVMRIRALKADLQVFETERLRLATQETDAASQLALEQNTWSDLNRSLDELEKSLAQPRKQ